MKKIVLATGGFDPMHSGHIAYLQAAKKLGDILVVGVNSDEWLVRKKGRAFMPLLERTILANSIKGVDYVIDFDDSDNSAKNAIQMVRQSYPQDRIIFANGGDRTDTNIPEMDIDDSNIEFGFGVGGKNKMNSSSWILQEWKAPKTERSWGYYRVLHDTETTKVKELVVNPGQTLSMQKHEHRNEYWHIAEGNGKLYETRETSAKVIDLYRHHTVTIPVGVWHRLENHTDKPLKIIEIQYGNRCVEDDIERKQV